MAKLGDIIGRGVTGSLPSAGVAGRLYYDTTLNKWQRDNGATWDDCEPDAALFALLADNETVSGDWIFETGITVGTGADADVTAMAVSVTGTPALVWDESEDGFTLNKGLNLTAGNLVGSSTLSFVNEVMNFPSLELADGAQPEWWEEQDGNITLTEEDVAGETITENYARCLKVVTIADHKYAYQRYTYANQPRLKAGLKCSALVAVWSVSAASAVIRLTTSIPTTVASAETIVAGWTILEAKNLTLDGTYVDLRLEVDTGTAYFVPLSVMVGSRALPLSPRGTMPRWADPVLLADLTGLGDPDAWTDVDCTSATSPIAVIANVGDVLRAAPDATEHALFYRHNASSDAKGDENQVGRVITGGVDCHFNTVPIILDDGQVFEYLLDRVSGTDTLSSSGIYLRGWYEWE
jgi:hypothetical protein